MNFQTKLFDVELFVDYTPTEAGEILWEDIYLSYAGKGLNGAWIDTGEMDQTWEDAMFDEEIRGYVEQLCREDYEAECIEREMMAQADKHDSPDPGVSIDREKLEWD